MKQVLLSLFIAGMVIQASAQANQQLSNLTSPTAVNQHLLPNGNNTRDLGSTQFSWRDIYLDGFIFMDDGKFISNAGFQSTFVGYQAGNINTGSYNSALGYRTLFSNNSGTYNTANGAFALYANTSGSHNTGTGSFALYRNTTGIYNTANGAYALYSNTTGRYNTGTGNSALYSNTTGNNNAAYGINALYANISGNGNTANGISTLIQNNTGSFNTAIGMEALYANTTGYSNTASGYRSLFSNTSGSRNVAMGNKALYSSVDDIGNVAIGDSALYKFNNPTIPGNEFPVDNELMVAIGQNALTSNTYGYYNTATGGHSLLRNTTGADNTAYGVFALEQNTTGYCNTAVGLRALDNNRTGSNNTAVGCNADININGLTNATAVGHRAIATASNQVMLGNTAVTSVRAAGNFVVMSDGRFKNNRKDNVPGLAFIKELKPITYNYDIQKLNTHISSGNSKANQASKSAGCCSIEEAEAIARKEKKLYTGFFAQEVEAAANKLGYDFSGVYKPENDKDAYGLSYAEFVVPLVKAVQELSQQNDEIKTEMESLKSEMNELKNMILSTSQGNVTTSNKYQTVNLSSASLSQNIPNPFKNTTTINYTLPPEKATAYIIITDKSGKTIKQINVSGSGKGSINVDASTLSSGAYNYSLHVDGRLIGTKQMVLAK